MRDIFNFIKALLYEKLEYELVSRAKLIKQFRNDSSPCCYDFLQWRFDSLIYLNLNS